MTELTKTPPSTTVKVGLKYLKNLGNFENVSIDIEVQDALRPGESVDEAFDRVYAKVDEQLAKRVREVVDRTS